MSEHKRNIYPTLWIKDKSLFDLLFKKTLPTFVMCESEKLLANYCVIYKKNITTELTPNNRQVFDSLYLFNADANRVKSELETHFFRLCKYKNSNSAVINGMLKQAWRENRHEAQLGVTHVAKMIDCNCILTDTTKWSLEFPDKTQLTVSTVDDEMCCVLSGNSSDHFVVSVSMQLQSIQLATCVTPSCASWRFSRHAPVLSIPFITALLLFLYLQRRKECVSSSLLTRLASALNR